MLVMESLKEEKGWWAPQRSPAQKESGPPQRTNYQLALYCVEGSGTHLPRTPHFLSLLFSFTTKNIWRNRNIWIRPQAKNKTNNQEGYSRLCVCLMSTLMSPVHEHPRHDSRGPSLTGLRTPRMASQSRSHSPVLDFVSGETEICKKSQSPRRRPQR